MSLLCCKSVMEWFKPASEKHLSLYDLTPQAALFGFTEKYLDDSILQNHLLLVFIIYLYKSRSYRFLLEIKKINCLEKKIAEANTKKHQFCIIKWNKIDNQLTINFLILLNMVNFFLHYNILQNDFLFTIITKFSLWRS